MQGYLIDTNIWIATSFAAHDHHQQAQRFLSSTSANFPAYLCRATEQSWLRLLTTPTLHRRYGSPSLTNHHAKQILTTYQALTNIKMIAQEPEKTRDLWLKLASIPSASPKVWMDAYLAAFAIRSALTFVTLDRDFCSYTSTGLDLKILQQ